MPNNATQSNEQQPTTPTQHTVKIAIERKDGKSQFVFSIPQALERILSSDASAEVATSVKWQGLQFYKVPNITKSPKYKELLANYNLFDDYGQDLLKGNMLNIAWLRTKGGQGTIAITENLGADETASMIRHAVNFIREYYNNYYKPLNIKGEVVIEM